METSQTPPTLPAPSLTPHIQAPKLPFNLTNTSTPGPTDQKKKGGGRKPKTTKKDHPGREEVPIFGGDPVHNARSEGEFKESEDWSLLLLR